MELYLFSPYGPYGLYRASVAVQGYLYHYKSGHKREENYENKTGTSVKALFFGVIKLTNMFYWKKTCNCQKNNTS